MVDENLKDLYKLNYNPRVEHRGSLLTASLPNVPLLNMDEANTHTCTHTTHKMLKKCSICHLFLLHNWTKAAQLLMDAGTVLRSGALSPVMLNSSAETKTGFFKHSNQLLQYLPWTKLHCMSDLPACKNKIFYLQ